MPPRFTILLSVLRLPTLIPQAVESILAQTIQDFELFIIGDGAPPETIAYARSLAQRDPRIQVREHDKCARVGEAYLHAALSTASGKYVAHIEDDDIWFPEHLQELESLLQTADFGHTIQVTTHPDGHVEALPSDIGNPRFRQRFVDELFNRFGYTVCGYRMQAYRSLAEGWALTPVGMYPDLHMWRKFFRQDGLVFGTSPSITSVAIPQYLREGRSQEERIAESRLWLARALDPAERAKIVEGGWRSLAGKGIEAELRANDLEASLRRANAALGQVETLHPGSLASLDDSIAAQTDARAALERLQAEYNLAQYCLTVLTKNVADLERERRERGHPLRSLVAKPLRAARGVIAGWTRSSRPRGPGPTPVE